MSVLGEGLLGFALGVSKSISDEYQNINDEKYKIQQEQRTEERAKASEQRAVERQIQQEKRAQLAFEHRARFAKELGLEYLPTEKQLETSLASDPSTNPAVAAQDLSARAENKRVMEDQDPSRTRNYMGRIDEGKLIDSELDPTTRRRLKDSEEGGWLDQQDERARNQAVAIDEARRNSKSAYLASAQYEADQLFTDEATLETQRKLLEMKREQKIKDKEAGVGENEFYFKADTVNKHFQSSIDVALGEGTAHTYRNLGKLIEEGEVTDVLATVRRGVDSKGKPFTIRTALDDPETREILRLQLLNKMSQSASGALQTKANKEQIGDLMTVQDNATSVIAAADAALAKMDAFTSEEEVAANIRAYEDLVRAGKSKQEAVASIFTVARGELARTLYPDDDPKKVKEMENSSAFRGLWQIYKEAYEKYYTGKFQ